MCIVFVSFDENPSPDGYKLIIAANRDEYYNRPTAAAHFWEDEPDIISGTDLFHGKEGGTWLGMTKTGKFGVLTNYRQSEEFHATNPKGRGFVVTDFLREDIDPENYIRQIEGDGGKYNGFNVIVGDLKTSESKCYWYCNAENKEVTMLHTGIHVLCNRTLDYPWPKVVYGREKFKDILKTSSGKEELLDGLIGLLNNEQRHFPNEDNSKYKTLHDEKLLPFYKDACRSICVTCESIGYGTRTNTVILVDANDHVTYVDRNIDDTDNTGNPHGKKWVMHRHEFKLLEKTNA